VRYHSPIFENALWQSAQFDELGKYIVSIAAGKNYPQTQTGVSLIRTQNIGRVYAQMEGAARVGAEIATAKTDVGDLVFVRVGVGVGDCCVVTAESSGCAFSDNTLRVKLRGINPEFAAIYLSLSIGRTMLIRNAKGSGKPVISGESIQSVPIPRICDACQEDICNQYRAAYQRRAAALREAGSLLAGMDGMLLERLGIGGISFPQRAAVAVRRGTLKADGTLGAEYYHAERLAAISALENNPAVTARRLSDIVGFARNTANPAESEMPYLGLSGVIANTGELSGAVEEAESPAFEYRAGDVLYARLRPYLNKVLYAEKSGICSTEFHVMRIKPDVGDVLPEYLAAIMRSSVTVRQTRHMMTGNTHPRISSEHVRNLRLPIPALDVQRGVAMEMRDAAERSRRLKRAAQAEWAVAESRFEKELLSASGGDS
jgi:hypothetical protein